MEPTQKMVYTDGTHELGVQNFLDQGYTIRRSLSASRPRLGQDVPVLECEWDGFGLHECWPCKAHVGEGAKDARIENVAERGKGRLLIDQTCVRHG